MSSNDKEEKGNKFFESRLMSIILMLCLILMCSLFVVIIWTLFSKEAALNVLMYLGIGSGAGIVVTLIILAITLTRNVKLGRNILLYLVGGILVISLIVSLILKFTISDPDLSSWAFINASSVGLGLTTGIAISYLILAMFKTPLTAGKREEIEEQLIEETKEE
jgi:MFS family permease